MRTSQLVREMRLAHGALTTADFAELADLGVAPLDIIGAGLVGVTRIAHVADTGCYEPDPSGALAFITPALTHCRRKIEMSPGAQNRDDTPGRGQDDQGEKT